MFDPSLLDHARTLLNSDTRRILGIVAPPGAGKSSLAEGLAEALGDKAQVVPMDGFHLSNRELERLGRAQRKGAPDTFDASGYLALLERLRHAGPDETVYAPAFYRELEEPIASSIAVAPDVSLVITEGNYLLLDQEPWVQAAALLDDVWFLDTDETLRHKWLLERHMRFGRSIEQARDWIRVTDQPNAELILKGRKRANAWLRWGENGFVMHASVEAKELI